jgi:hypothetical protein
MEGMVMSNLSILDQLRSVVKTAEHTGKVEVGKKAIEKSADRLKEATALCERAAMALAKAKQQYGDPDAAKTARLGELQELVAIARENSKYIESGVDINAMVKEATLSIEKEWVEASQEINKRQQAVDDARQAYDEAVESLAVAKNMVSSSHVIEMPCLAGLPDTPHDQISHLIEEARNAEVFMPEWTSKMRHAKIREISGKSRLLQDTMAISESEHRRMKAIFGRLNDYMDEYKPGFVDALNRKYVPQNGWRDYIAQAETDFAVGYAQYESMKLANAELKAKVTEQQARKQKARADAEGYFVLLETLVTKHQDAKRDEGIRDIVKTLLVDAGIEADDDRLNDIVDDVADLFQEGPEFRALRKNLARNGGMTQDELSKRFPNVLAKTKGKTAFLFGGDAREERRAKLQELFGFSKLEWYEGWRDNAKELARVDHNIRKGGIDFLLALTGYVGHQVNNLKTACETGGCRFVTVKRGYGAVAIATAINAD